MNVWRNLEKLNEILTTGALDNQYAIPNVLEIGVT
jgi:hypothetical protein